MFIVGFFCADTSKVDILSEGLDETYLFRFCCQLHCGLNGLGVCDI